jgi:hypothetical protein
MPNQYSQFTDAFRLNLSRPISLEEIIEISGNDLLKSEIELAIIEGPTSNDPDKSALWHCACSAFLLWESLPMDEVLKSDSKTIARRGDLLRIFGFSDETGRRFANSLPALGKPSTQLGTTPTRGAWKAVSEHLASKKNRIPDEALKVLDSESEVVVSMIRKAKSRRDDESKPVKGLVVGHVQSGKTMNMTALAAKLIDEGINLVIVLAGDKDLLRVQTQRRFDSDLIGSEAMYEVKNDSMLPEEQPYAEYRQTEIQTFAQTKISAARLTDVHRDFLQKNPSGMVGDLRARDLTSKTVFVVIKKQHDQIEALHNAIRKSNSQAPHEARDIRALILDDECDHASPKIVNTEPRETNTQLNNLINQLPGVIYIGYTATPYSTICIDRGANDVYPDDFVHVLEQSSEYFGYERFFDLDLYLPNSDTEIKNEQRFVRLPERETSRGRSSTSKSREATTLATAIDMFVLTGAIKIWRNLNKPDGSPFVHHTMLCHESHEKDRHIAMKNRVDQIWKSRNYELVSGQIFEAQDEGNARFQICFDDLIKHSSDLKLLPESLDELRPHIQRFLEIANLPMALQGGNERDLHEVPGPGVMVNSVDSFRWEWNQMSELEVLRSSEIRKGPEDLEVAKIIIGGNVLSRGYTIEGLTISYFGRCTLQLDSLLQMERWLGYRGSYFDLMRLYLEPPVQKRDKNSGREILARFRKVSAIDRDVRALLKSREDHWHEEKNSIIAQLETVELEGTVLTSKDNFWKQEYEAYRGQIFAFAQLSSAESAHEGNFKAFEKLVQSSENLVKLIAVTKRTAKEYLGQSKLKIPHQSTTWFVGDLPSESILEWVESLSKEKRNSVIASDLVLKAHDSGLNFKVLVASRETSAGSDYQPIKIGSSVIYPSTGGSLGVEDEHFTHIGLTGGPYSRALSGALGINPDVILLKGDQGLDGDKGDELSTAPGFYNSKNGRENFIALVFVPVYQKTDATGLENPTQKYPAVFPIIQIPNWVTDLENQKFRFLRQLKAKSPRLG